MLGILQIVKYRTRNRTLSVRSDDFYWHHAKKRSGFVFGQFLKQLSHSILSNL